MQNARKSHFTCKLISKYFKRSIPYSPSTSYRFKNYTNKCSHKTAFLSLVVKRAYTLVANKTFIIFLDINLLFRGYHFVITELSKLFLKISRFYYGVIKFCFEYITLLFWEYHFAFSGISIVGGTNHILRISKIFGDITFSFRVDHSVG